MPKRRHEDESNEEKWLRKMKKYERKLEARRARRIIYSDEDDVNNEEHLEYNLSPPADCDPAEDNQEMIIINEDDPSTSGNTDTCVSKEEDKPVVDITTTDEDLNFDPALLSALGEIEPDVIEYGDNLQADVAKHFEKILMCGLKKENKEELLKKYLFPKNLPLAKSPELNPEIVGMLAEVCKLRDKRILVKQNQLGISLSALGKAITGLLKKDPDIPEIIRTLNDAGKLLADSHYMETNTRRAVIIPLVDKSLADSFKEKKRDKFLFGENLGDLVKNSRGIKRTSQMIQATSSNPNSNLNGKGSSTRARQQRNPATYSYRAGGPRTATSYPNRRRGYAPPPPPPPPQRFVRRQAPLPPPPQPPPRRHHAPVPAQRFPANRST